jgi:alcohol dehydrogenase class IV
MMPEVTLSQPPMVRFGVGSRHALASYLAQRHLRAVHVLCSPSLQHQAAELVASCGGASHSMSLQVVPSGEPTVASFNAALRVARHAAPGCIVGIGGGSVLDVAKLVAAFANTTKPVAECFGIGLLPGRACHLICLPTTAGTGSEVSPNAILLDEDEQLKKGVISPFLVPDAIFIDPELMLGVPPQVTAFTGLDTLTHCIEAYTNRFAHPLVDLYALEGIRLTARFLVRAVHDGRDLEAREGMAAASYLGGLCLGPVNTAAVHALAYPLGSRYHIAHGLSNAILLAPVSRFNLPAATQRYAAIALALGAEGNNSDSKTANQGIVALEQLIKECGINTGLAPLGVRPEDIPSMAQSAFTVQRLLKNNPRTISLEDIETIYATCFQPSSAA